MSKQTDRFTERLSRQPSVSYRKMSESDNSQGAASDKRPKGWTRHFLKCWRPKPLRRSVKTKRGDVALIQLYTTPVQDTSDLGEELSARSEEGDPDPIYFNVQASFQEEHSPAIYSLETCRAPESDSRQRAQQTITRNVDSTYKSPKGSIQQSRGSAEGPMSNLGGSPRIVRSDGVIDNNVEDVTPATGEEKPRLATPTSDERKHTEDQGKSPHTSISTQTTSTNQEEDNNAYASTTRGNQVAGSAGNGSNQEAEKNIRHVKPVQVSEGNSHDIPNPPSSPNISEVLRAVSSVPEIETSASSSDVSNGGDVVNLIAPPPNELENVVSSSNVARSDNHSPVNTHNTVGAASAGLDHHLDVEGKHPELSASSSPAPENSSSIDDVVARRQPSNTPRYTSHRKSSTAPAISSADVDKAKNVPTGSRTESMPVLTSFDLNSLNHTISIHSLIPGSATNAKQESIVGTPPSERNDSNVKPENLRTQDNQSDSEPRRNMMEPQRTSQSHPVDSMPSTSYSRLTSSEANHHGTRVSNNPEHESRDRSENLETAESLLPHLCKKVLNPDYHPVHEKVREFIHSACADQVQCGAFYQAPSNSKDIDIVGGNIEFLRSIIFPTMAEFPGYKFTITESTNPMHVEHYGGDVFFKVHQKFHAGRGYSGKAEDGEQNSTCGLVLQAPNQDVHSPTKFYAVFPAHVVIKEYCAELYHDAKTMQQVRDEIILKADKVSYELNSYFYDSSKENDLRNLRPMFCFRWFKPKGPQMGTYRAFMNDIAVLPIEHWQIHVEEERQPGVKKNELVSAMTQLKDHTLTEKEIKEKTIAIRDVIFPLESVDTLVEMGKQGIQLIVGDRVGWMVPCGEEIKYHGRPWAHAIEFVMLKGEFKDGDCGLVAYVKDRRDGTLYPFGMFIGKSNRKHSCGARIYAAIVLSQAIKELEETYPRLLPGLKPVPSPGSRNCFGENMLSHLCKDPARSSAIGNACQTGTRPKEYRGGNASHQSRRDADESGLGESVPESSSLRSPHLHR